MPNVVILAGPNGAGKTSAAPTLVRDELRIADFVNADVIARGLSGFSADTVAVHAGRMMLRRLEILASSGQDFAFETTLSGNAFLADIKRWRSTGYTIRIIYLWLLSPETAIARVRARVGEGGHLVPDHDVRRRYGRRLLNFVHRYRDAADRWYLYDNTDPLDLGVVARGGGGVVDIIDAERWERFERQAGSIGRFREVFTADRPPVVDDHIERWFADSENLAPAMRIVHARVIRRHRLLNQPLITWRDRKVVELDPHTVPMPEGVTEEQMGPVFDYL